MMRSHVMGMFFAAVSFKSKMDGLKYILLFSFKGIRLSEYAT